MSDTDKRPSPPGRRRRRPLGLAAMAAGALLLGVAAPVAALLPIDAEMPWFDGGYEPAPADGGVWVPPPSEVSDAPAPEPAPAPAPDPAPAPPPAPPVPEPEPQGGTSQQVLKDAVDAALAMLAGGPCATHVGNSPDYPISNAEAPADVLRALSRNPDQLVNRSQEERVGSDGGAIVAAANGDGATGTITVYWGFFRLNPSGPNVINSYNTYSGGFLYRLTPVEWRAMVLLHELMHLQGTLAADHGGNEVAAEEAIIAACIPNAAREPVVTVPSGPPDPIPLGPTDIIDPWLNPPVLLPPPPSDPGDSEFPEIGVCCDEVDPGDSEFPEIGECCDEVIVPDDDVPYDPVPRPGYDDGGWYGGGGGGGSEFDHWYDVFYDEVDEYYAT